MYLPGMASSPSTSSSTSSRSASARPPDPAPSGPAGPEQAGSATTVPAPAAPARQQPATRPNTAFRRLRGSRSPSEFAAAVRRAAREIGEQVSCDARYIGRVEAGAIRCPNYAYERVFLHMFPGRTLADLGFAPREAVRGRGARERGRHEGDTAAAGPRASSGEPDAPEVTAGLFAPRLAETLFHTDEESDVLRRAFMTGGPAALAASLGLGPGPAEALATPDLPTRAGESEAHAVEQAVRHIRLLDDQHGADSLFQRAGTALRGAYRLLDTGIRRQSVADRLHSGAGELAISVGWLAHDSGQLEDARSHYAEALATARVAGDPGLEAHAFCNTAFLARDAGRPREAVRAAQAGQLAAAGLGSPRLLALLSLREAGGRSGLGDRSGCQEALGRAHDLFAHGPSDTDPEWMTFFGEAELAGLEAQCWAALGDFGRASVCARRAVELQPPHFARNRALFTAELADDLAASRAPEEAAAQGLRALDLLASVHSTRIRTMLRRTAARLLPHQREPHVLDFLEGVRGT
ncbi:hypothetical protein [Streptomyces sp. JJ38]|uniref:hypothetical protein n=1 Tax=Streptomyces sp. JJ38 TaxID=2738128 RepID=UPI0035B46F76